MIATLINFSTNEAPFLRQCLEEAFFFSTQVIVIVCDHFFDGTPENLSLLRGIYAAHPEVEFIQYAWDINNFYGRHSSYFWHNLSRLIGSDFVCSEAEYILFLDVDEIPSGRQVAKWLEIFPLKNYEALRLACYWYFRKAYFRAETLEDTPLLLHKRGISYDVIMHPCERAGSFDLIKGDKLRFAGEDAPLFHHYSWARSKEALLRKVRSWGHRGERDWEEMIEKEFSGPFSGRDFVHGYQFNTVDSSLKIGSYESTDLMSKNVRLLNTGDIHKIDIRLKFGI